MPRRTAAPDQPADSSGDRTIVRAGSFESRAVTEALLSPERTDFRVQHTCRWFDLLCVGCAEWQHPSCLVLGRSNFDTHSVTTADLAAEARCCIFRNLKRVT